MDAVLGYLPDLTTPISGKHKLKAQLCEAQRACQRADWTAHTTKHKPDGGALYSHMPSPAFRGFVAKQRNYQHSDADIGILMNLRLHSHCLRSLTGAQCTPVTPLHLRTCTLCAGHGSPAIEDEPHFVLRCPAHDGERAGMLDRLQHIYPGFAAQWRASNGVQKMRLLLWGIPDGTAPWQPRAGTRGIARVQATGAVLRFLGAAAKRHPHMRNLFYGRAPGA